MATTARKAVRNKVLQSSPATIKLQNQPRYRVENEAEGVRLDAARSALKVLQNYASRLDWAAEHARSSLDPRNRNLDFECGYPVVGITTFQYREMYRFNTLAGRVVNALPDECFRADPEVFEDDDPTSLTPFEEDFQQVLARFPDFWNTLLRADRESRYGTHGGLVFGVADGNAPDLPLGRTKLGPQGLLYLIPCGAEELRIAITEQDATTARFGMPAEYTVVVGEPKSPGDTIDVQVHHTRVVHLADNLGSGNGVYGRPTMECCFNRLLDLRKVLAASAEGYWKSAFPGISFETLAEVIGRASYDKASLQTEYRAFLDGQQRGLFLDGVHANQLANTSADPTPFAMLQVKLIAADADIPEQVLLGSQVAKGAGGDNTVRWQSKVRGRQTNHLTPNLVLKAADLLVRAGVCRAPKKPLQVWWPEVNLQSPKDQADTAVKITQALLQYVTSGAELVFPLKYFLSEVLRLPARLVSQIETAAGKAPNTKQAWKDPKANGSGAGKADASKKRGGTSRNGNAKR